MASVSVIIVNYNGGEALQRCLAALATQTLVPDEVFLVDNASQDGSGEEAARAFPSITYLPQDQNLGFAAGNNVAARQAKGDWLALLNPDAYPEPDWLAELVEGTRRHPDAVAFGSLQLMAEDLGRIDGAGDCFHALGSPYRGHHGWPREAEPPEGFVLSPCAAAALYRRDAFEAAGGFDERFFCYSEDVDLGMRLFAQHGPAVHLPKAIVLHEGSKITGRISPFTIYHGHRNRLWAWAKNAPPLLFWGLMPAQALLTLFLGLSFLRRGVAGAYLRGVRDALRSLPAMRRARRPLSTGLFARYLVWSPVKLRRRSVKLRTQR
ncbi:glycosyltransferase family 2 protein [Parvularcula maris]|uniref:Glycosyltransferase family 2 protein n=1 Tax=Parvularcula maris TaxID=2965077 RepID=A0A9X2RIH5_9PROT|nr:glycosyltransferase family 2 protein [Parvularcula maris]MCQ8185999.1 glycosyltransferase family 2 protein [Parvularcula maris]